MEIESIKNIFEYTFTAISQAKEAVAPQLTIREVGTVTSVATGVAKVSGLPNVGFDELIIFPGNVLGIAFNLDALDFHLD